MQNKKNKIHFLKYLLTLLLIILFNSTNLNFLGAQTTAISDTIRLSNGMKGFAKYQNLVSGQTSLFHNDFYFQKNRTDSIDPEVMRAIIYKGKYNNGLKIGPWTFEYDRLLASEQRFIEDLKIRQLASGKRTIIRANFANGIAADEWTVRKTKVIDSQDTDSSFYARCNFSNHRFFGDFVAWSDSLSITGQVNELGHFDGEWAFRHRMPSGAFVNEFRVYDDGVLTQHAFYIAGKELEITNFGIDETPDDDEDWVDLEVEDLYFEILLQSVLYDQSENDLRSLFNNSNTFLKFSVQAFGFDNSVPIWSLQKNEKNIALPKVKLRKHSLNQELQAKLQKSLDLMQRSQAKIDGFLTDPQVEINRFNAKEIAQYFALFQVYKVRVDQLTHLLTQLNSPAFDYISREEILPKMLNQITFPSSVSYTFNEIEQNFEHAFPSNLEEEAMNLVTLLQTTEEICTAIKKRHAEIQPLLERNKNQAQIALLEQQLVVKRDSVIAFFNNQYKQEDFNKLHLKYQVAVQNKVNQIFEEYSKQELNQRLESISATLLEMDAYLQFYKELVRIHKEMEYIEKDLYTRTVWNPYTFTDMDEIVKERVFNAYKSYLLPHILKFLETELSTAQITLSKQQLEATFTQMKKLRNEDTKLLESQLRKQTNPIIIAELLHIKLVP